MRKNFVVEKIFAETLHFLLISSIGYPYSGYQTNAMNTSNDILTSSAAPYSTLASANHLSGTTHLDKKLLNDSNSFKISTHFAKRVYLSKSSNSQETTEGVINYSTEASVLKESLGTVVLESSTDMALRTRLPTTASSFQTPRSSTTKPTETKAYKKSVLPKLQKTDAPMLNYIFDMFSTANKHHHHDQRYGPHFEDIQKDGTPSNITVQAGASVYLNCRISLLQDKTVSWVRRNSMGEDALELLTVGLHTYTGDKRYTMEFQYPNNWRLKIVNAKKEDEATYECQISTHPPRVIQIHLHINAPKVVIVDEYDIRLQEKYYEIDSTLQLSCIVRNVVMTSSVVFWRHGDQILNYDTTRGGVSVRTDLMDDGANSSLSIARVNKQDSGNYTCSISDSQDYTIVVHILKGESFAELHHGTGTHLCDHYAIALLIIPIILVLSQTTNTFR